MCQQINPIYRINANAPCEVQIYEHRQPHYNNCNIKYINAKNTIWIALHQPGTWLYSTAADLQVTIQCNEQHEYRETIKNTGRVTLKGKCKLTTSDMTIQVKNTVYETDTETYLPEMNITLLRDLNTSINNDLMLIDVTKDKSELAELKTKIHIIKNNIENDEQQFFMKKQFLYPMATNGIILIIVIIIIIYIIRKNKKTKQLPVYRPTTIPKPILKRSLSTRY